MDPVVTAVLSSWKLEPGLLCVLIAAAWIYLRGARQWPGRYSALRRTSFLAGLVAVWIALASPLDAFGGLLLEAHMTQHLLLILIAPLLLLYGQPVLAILRGVPRLVLKNVLGPFLQWSALRAAGRAITHPIVTWIAMALGIVVWHIPALYELGLRSPAWHEVQHACFFSAGILFWWPVIQVWPGHTRGPRWAMIPYLIAADLVNTALAAAMTFASRAWYPTYELVPRLWGISALEDQASAGAIMWVPGSIVMLLPAVVLAVRAASPPRRKIAHAIVPAPPRRKVVRKKWPHINVARRTLQTVMFLLAAAVVVHGFIGPQVSQLNLAGVLPWTHWRGLTVIALLIAGNLFCMACPFTFARDAGRRMFMPAKRQWPKWLRSKWLAFGLVAIFFWSYEAFRLWDRPWWTAWIIVGYFATSFLVDGIFQNASFCKYVCPIGQFHFVQSFVSPLEVRAREAAVCKSCTTHDCLLGNAQHRGCELLLFQPEKRGNFDCTFCLDCVQSCPHDNVGILPAPIASRVTDDRRLSQRRDVIALVILMVFGAFVTAAGMTGPVMSMMHGAHAQMRSMLGSTTLFYFLGLLVAPAIAIFLCSRAARDLTGRFVLALIPLGFGMWLAHFTFHLARGADILGIELLAIDAGLIVTLYILWRVATLARVQVSQAFAAVAPWCTLAIGLWAAGFWILLQPMDMR
jgi:cytochrome c oxidase assembly factor CtaG